MLGLSGNQLRGGKENKQRLRANVRLEIALHRTECTKEERHPQQDFAVHDWELGEAWVITHQWVHRTTLNPSNG